MFIYTFYFLNNFKKLKHNLRENVIFLNTIVLLLRLHSEFVQNKTLGFSYKIEHKTYLGEEKP